MTRAEAVQQLESRLTNHIADFVRKENEDMQSAGAELGWVGDDLHRLMAKAALSVWEASADVQAFLKTEGYLNTGCGA